MSRRLVCLPAFVALAVWAGCGGGGEDPTSTSASRVEPAQARANARVKAHNEKVRQRYQERRRAEAPTESEVEAERAAAEAYEGMESISGARYLAPEVNIQIGLNRAGGAEGLREFCDFMSTEAREQTIAYVEQTSSLGGIEWDCEKAVALLVRRSNQATGHSRPAAVEVVGINAKGRRGTATIRVGDAPLTTVPLVREEGEWKLAARPSVPERP